MIICFYWTISLICLDLDALTNTLMESCNFPDLDKYSTLPNKSQIQGSFPRELKRPASTAGQQLQCNQTSIFLNNTHYNYYVFVMLLSLFLLLISKTNPCFVKAANAILAISVIFYAV